MTPTPSIEVARDFLRVIYFSGARLHVSNLR